MAAAPPALAARQWLLAYPRPASGRPSSAAALFSPLLGTGQTGFSAPGWCSLRQPRPPLTARDGGGPGRRPSLCPSWGRRGARLQTSGLLDAAQVEPRALGGPRWQVGARRWLASCQFRDPAAAAALGFPDAPASLGAALATPPHQPSVTFPLPWAGLAAARGR